MKTLELTTLFGKLTEHEYELNTLEVRITISKKKITISKKKEKVREENISIFLKVSTFKARVDLDNESINDDSSKKEEMGLFVKRYN